MIIMRNLKTHKKKGGQLVETEATKNVKALLLSTDTDLFFILMNKLYKKDLAPNAVDASLMKTIQKNVSQSVVTAMMNTKNLIANNTVTFTNNDAIPSLPVATVEIKSDVTASRGISVPAKTLTGNEGSLGKFNNSSCDDGKKFVDFCKSFIFYLLKNSGLDSSDGYFKLTGLTNRLAQEGTVFYKVFILESCICGAFERYVDRNSYIFFKGQVYDLGINDYNNVFDVFIRNKNLYDVAVELLDKRIIDNLCYDKQITGEIRQYSNKVFEMNRYKEGSLDENVEFLKDKRNDENFVKYLNGESDGVGKKVAYLLLQYLKNHEGVSSLSEDDRQGYVGKLLKMAKQVCKKSSQPGSSQSEDAQELKRDIQKLQEVKATQSKLGLNTEETDRKIQEKENALIDQELPQLCQEMWKEPRESFPTETWNVSNVRSVFVELKTVRNISDLTELPIGYGQRISQSIQRSNCTKVTEDSWALNLTGDMSYLNQVKLLLQQYGFDNLSALDTYIKKKMEMSPLYSRVDILNKIKENKSVSNVTKAGIYKRLYTYKASVANVLSSLQLDFYVSMDGYTAFKVNGNKYDFESLFSNNEHTFIVKLVNSGILKQDEIHLFYNLTQYGIKTQVFYVKNNQLNTDILQTDTSDTTIKKINDDIVSKKNKEKELQTAESASPKDDNAIQTIKETIKKLNKVIDEGTKQLEEKVLNSILSKIGVVITELSPYDPLERELKTYQDRVLKIFFQISFEGYKLLFTSASNCQKAPNIDDKNAVITQMSETLAQTQSELAQEKEALKSLEEELRMAKLYQDSCTKDSKSCPPEGKVLSDDVFNSFINYFQNATTEAKINVINVLQSYRLTTEQTRRLPKGYRYVDQDSKNVYYKNDKNIITYTNKFDIIFNLDVESHTKLVRTAKSLNDFVSEPSDVGKNEKLFYAILFLKAFIASKQSDYKNLDIKTFISKYDNYVRNDLYFVSGDANIFYVYNNTGTASMNDQYSFSNLDSSLYNVNSNKITPISDKMEEYYNKVFSNTAGGKKTKRRRRFVQLRSRR
jgi:hypothetical protein